MLFESITSRHTYSHQCRYCHYPIRLNETGLLWIDSKGGDICHSPDTDKTLHEPEKKEQ